VKLDVWTVKRVRDLLQVDLLDLSDGGDDGHGAKGLLYRLIADPSSWWTCCTSSVSGKRIPRA